METPWRTDMWYVSPYNFDSGATELKFPKRVIVADCTLREGEQQPGVILNQEQKIAFAKALDDLGIPEIEASMPVVSMLERETVKAIAHSGIKAKLTCLARARKEDIDIAAESGIHRVNLSMPASRNQIEQKLRMTYDQAVDAVVEMSNYAADKGLKVTISPYDTTRAEMDFLQRYIVTAQEKGTTDRVRLVDTRGCATPTAIAFMVRKIKEFSDLPIEIHAHDDFGMGTANVIAALAAGAQVASTTFNGMGERAGNAATEEVILALRVLYGIDTGAELSKLCSVSELLQQMTGVKIQPHKAVGGGNAFTFEGGIGVAGLMSGDLVSQAYLPKLVGGKERVLLGKKSGKQSIRYKMGELGIDLSDSQILALVLKVKDMAEGKGRAISDDEFLALVKETPAQ